LAQSGDGGLALLAEDLDSPVAEVRKRAVQSIAEIPNGEATALLHDALRTPTSWSAGMRLWRSGHVE
jgi:HEAT repeat protein